MDLGKLDEVYDEILGESGEKIETADPEPDAPAKGDPAYKEPAYDGLDGDDGVDPRDPSTKQDDDKPDDDDDDDDGEPKGDADEEYEDIPDELVAAGRQAGYSNEEIIDLDADNPAVLEALARAFKAKGPEPKAKAEPEPKPEPDKKPEPKPKPESLELKFDLPGLDDELSQVAGPVQEAFNKLLSRVNDLQAGLGKTQESMVGVEKSREAEMFRQVDVFFDNQAEQLPELGDSKKEIDQVAVDARMYAWNIANDLMTGSKGKIELREALQIGVNALRGQVSETKLKARVVSDLNKRKQKFSPRPKGGRRGGQKPQTEEERGIAAIDEVLDDPKY